MSKVITVIASDVDEALEKLNDTMLSEAILNIAQNGGTGTCEFGDCIPYTYKGSDDCEWVERGEFEFTLDDLDIGIDEVLDEIKYCNEELEEKHKEIKKLKKELNEFKRRYNDLFTKIDSQG